MQGRTAAEGPDPLASPELRALIGPYLAITPHGMITDANDQAVALFARPRSFLVGKPVQSVVEQSYRPAARRELALITASSAHGTFLTRFERRSGVPFEAEVTVYPARANGSEGDGVYLAIRDVTEREQTQQRLWELNADLEHRIVERSAELEVLSEESERRRAYLETVVQHIPAGLVIFDAETGAVTMANERAREIVGVASDAAWSPDEWTTRARGAVDADGRKPLDRALQGETLHGERVTVRHPDGRDVVLDMNSAPIRGRHGEVLAVAALFQDVTLAERRHRSSVEFVANAAHELRTPLAAIVSGVEVLESGAKELPVERDRFLVHIGREAERLVRLTRALLLLARIQSGIEEARAEVLELAPMLAAVADGLRPAAGVKVLVRCPADAAAIAARGLLEQALTSVATNAARYTESGRISLSVAQRGARVRIRVRDTGRGMTPDELARAGERFFRSQDPAAPGGFGLGLAIASEAVHAMGGTLDLSSEEGAGTTVDIGLPAARLVSTA
jgi:two-component system phosphate regulon sensor histidine kinase PhoR